MAAKTATRQLILEAVITSIEKYGIDKLTTRKIALEAGTNIASINYHFRSKDELVAEALSMTIQHMMQDVFTAIDDREQPFESALANVFFYLLNGSRLFPGVTRAHLYRAAVQRDDDSISAQAMRRVFDRLCQRTMQEFPSLDPHRIRFIISGIMSTIMFSLLTPGFFPIPRAYQPINSKNARTVADLYARQVVSALQ
jgi:AcrR family transcriptional regulator